MTRVHVLAVLAMATLGCSRPPMSGPPETRLGRDECGECGMLVSEDRFSGATLLEREGERMYIHFDDIGCMLDYEHDKGPSIKVLDRFVRDHGSRAWVSASEAVFVFADRDRLRTPMGSGIAAAATRERAEGMRAVFGGELMDWDRLKMARREWMEARYGTGTRAPGR